MTPVPPEVDALVAFMPDDFAIVRQTPAGPKGRCIEATRIGVAFLRAAGVECWPMACEVQALNPLARRLTEQGVPIALWPDDAWSVGVRIEEVPGDSADEPHRRVGFSCHVVIRGPGWFCDLTAPQLHRPDRGIHVPGAIAGPAGDDRGVEVTMSDGSVIRWFWRPDFRRYRNTPAWRQDVPHELVARARAAIREKVTASS